MRALRSLLLAAALLLADAAGANITPAPPTPRTYVGRQYTAELWICVIPDVQNYCSSAIGLANPTVADYAEGVRQLAIMSADIIAMRCDFALQVGDIQDQAGSTGNDATDGDHYVTNPARYAEATCIRENLFDKLDEAGIPWLAVTGNHDSYRDFERAFPRSEFLLKSYAYSAQNEVDRWHAGFSDTEQRAALFSTSVGPVCAVGSDYVLDAAGGTLDVDYQTASYGCGAGHPTIGVRHWGVMAGMSSAANNEVFMVLNGHKTSPPPYQTVTDTAQAGGFHTIDVLTNSQESSLDCGAGTHNDGTSVHTGTGWWTTVQIVPEANVVAIQARDSLRGGQAGPSRCGWTYNNAVVNLATSLCTRFPTMVGC